VEKSLKQLKAAGTLRLLRTCHGKAESTATRVVICSDIASQPVQNPTSYITCRTGPLPLKVTMSLGPTWKLSDVHTWNPSYKNARSVTVR